MRRHAPPDALESLRTLVGSCGTDARAALGELARGPLDDLVLPIAYGYGHLARVLEASGAIGWRRAVSQPWLIAALADAGRIQEALDLYEAIRGRGRCIPVIGLTVGSIVISYILPFAVAVALLGFAQGPIPGATEVAVLFALVLAAWARSRRRHRGRPPHV